MGKGSKVDWSTPSRSRFRYSMKGVAEGGLTARDGSSVQRVHHIVAKESTPLVPGNHTRVPALSFHYEKVADGDVERRVYDADFAARMKAYRLARARRVSDWAEQWLALEGEYLTRSRRARSLLGDLVTSVALHDGHVAEVVLTARALLERGAELLIRAPRVRHLHVTGYAEVGPSLFSCASLRGMQSLGLRAEGLGDEDVDALAASPFVDGLRWLDLAHNCLGQRSRDPGVVLHPLTPRVPRIRGQCRRVTRRSLRYRRSRRCGGRHQHHRNGPRARAARGAYAELVACTGALPLRLSSVAGRRCDVRLTGSHRSVAVSSA